MTRQDMDRLPSAWEIGSSSEGAMEAAAKGLRAVTQTASVVALGIEAFLFGGASRKATGGAKQVLHAATGRPPPVDERPPWLGKQEKLRNTTGLEASHVLAKKGQVEEKQGQSFAEQKEERRRRNEKAARERAERKRVERDFGR